METSVLPVEPRRALTPLIEHSRAAKRAVRVLVLLGGIALAQDANAQDPKRRASELFTQGETRFRAGDYAGAAAAFDEAYRLAPHPNVLWNAARSFERADEPARAANAYQAYLDSTGSAPDRAAAAQSLARLSKRLGRLELHPADGQPAAVDGVRVTRPVYFVSPGTHTVVLSAEGRGDFQTVAVEAGGTRSVSAVAIAPAPEPGTAPSTVIATTAPPAPPEGPPPPSRGISPIFFYVGTGLTLVATGFAVGFGIDTKSARDRFDAAPSRDAFERGRDKQFRTNLALGTAIGLGAVTAITGIWLVNWQPKGTTAHLRAGLTAIEFGASFE